MVYSIKDIEQAIGAAETAIAMAIKAREELRNLAAMIKTDSDITPARALEILRANVRMRLKEKRDITYVHYGTDAFTRVSWDEGKPGYRRSRNNWEGYATYDDIEAEIANATMFGAEVGP